MKKGEIRDVAEQGDVQLNLLDEQDLMEVESDLYPGEQIVLCRNPLRAQAGKEQREALWKKAEKRFEKIVQNIKKPKTQRSDQNRDSRRKNPLPIHGRSVLHAGHSGRTLLVCPE